MLDGQAVLHLDEVHPARRAEDAVAAVDDVALGRRAGDELGDRRRRPREAAPDLADEAEAEVLADPLVADVAEPRLRAARLVGADVALDLAAPAAAGHPVQLEVVDGGGVLEQPVEDVVERLDGLAGVQVERRHALQRDLGDDARARRRPTRATRSSSASVGVDATTSPVPVTSSIPTTVVARLPSPSPVPWVAVAMAPAIDWRSMSPRFGIASPTAASSSLRRCRRMPRLHGHALRLVIDVEDALHAGRARAARRRSRPPP